MAATTAGAVKAFLEAQGLGVSVYRDQAPEDPPFPHVTVREMVSVTVDPHGDFAASGVTELAQVDVWQQWRNPSTRAVTESYTLADAVIKRLHGAVLTAAPKHAYGCRVVGATRLIEQDENVAHTAVTIEIRRDI